ncbi:hypothetical protein [Corallococcus terminator]|uniref:Lipoprotein n=1 Tax=Corallococcus terminator TaxID=2316733 RepID=A0A3A8I554_9BACT|nr:hypothetical protein [Corallococcus terminator]RKG73431.1 hypothetical protein D7V88_36420 [Corallococcus terminator]
MTWMRWMGPLALSLVSLGCAGASTRPEPEGSRVVLASVDPACSPEKSTQCLCVGTPGAAAPRLEEIGVDLNALKTGGVPCVQGDFDQGGQPDYAFPGKGYSCNQPVPVRVLFTKDGQVRDVLALSREVSCLQLYAPRSTPGPQGEPATERQGLVDWGEGNATWVYLLDGKQWATTTHPSESR